MVLLLNIERHLTYRLKTKNLI